MAEDEMLVYYRDESAGKAACTAELDRSGEHTTVHPYAAGPLRSEWTHLVGTGDRFLWYNQHKTSAVTGKIFPDGNHFPLKQYPPGSCSTWTLMCASNDRILTYHPNGDAAFCAIDWDDNLTTLPDVVRLPAGLTHVAANSVGQFLGFDSASGKAYSLRFDEGLFKDYVEVGGFAAWTHVIGLSGIFFFYDRSSGTAHTVRMKEGGALESIEPISGFGQWTHIVFAGVGPKAGPLSPPEMGPEHQVLFYNSEEGSGATGWFTESDGKYHPLKYWPTGFTKGWSLIAAERTEGAGIA